MEKEFRVKENLIENGKILLNVFHKIKINKDKSFMSITGIHTT